MWKGFEAFGSKLDPLLEAIKEGTIFGVAETISCTTLRDTGQDVHTVRVAKKLIKQDIVMLSMGCGNGADDGKGI